MLKIVLNLLLVLSNVRVIFCYRYEAIKLLDQIVKLDNIPTSFIFKTCWSVNENLKLMHTLKTPIAFLTGDSVLEMRREKGHEIMVVLDLNCTDNLNYIKQVSSENTSEVKKLMNTKAMFCSFMKCSLSWLEC